MGEFGIFFLVLTIACGLFQSSIYFQHGAYMRYLQPYADWFLGVNGITLIGTLSLLKYFHFKNKCF